MKCARQWEGYSTVLQQTFTHAKKVSLDCLAEGELQGASDKFWN